MALDPETPFVAPSSGLASARLNETEREELERIFEKVQGREKLSGADKASVRTIVARHHPPAKDYEWLLVFRLALSLVDDRLAEA